MDSNPNDESLTLRSVNITVEDSGPRLLTLEEYLQLSPTEKFRALRERRFVDERSGRRAASVGPAVIAYCIFTMPFTMTFAVLPHVCAQEPSSLPYWRAAFLYFAVMTIANWLLMQCFDSRIRRPISCPPHLIGRSAEAPREGSKASFLWSFPAEPISGLRWRWCQKCESHAPPRTHHCPICNACVLLRDHHCFFTGNCIGVANQRFFAPFALHCCIICLFNLFLCPSYLLAAFAASQINPWLGFLLPPYAILSFLFGGFSLANLVVLSHLGIVVWGWLVCFIFFVQQFALNLLGRTSFEVHSSDSIWRPSVGVINRLSVSERQRRIFGRWWALNFLCPMHWLFATPQDGWEHPGVVDTRGLIRRDGR